MKPDHFSETLRMDAGHIPKIDFHLHTKWTDGMHSVAQMHESAVNTGLERILFSEHARKTSVDWFGRFADEVRALPGSACRALVGVETKVEDLDGRLDTVPEITEQCDLVMASVHRFPGEKGKVRGFGEVSKNESVEMEFKLACAILKNPVVDILAHPFGMCYRRFDTPPPDDMMKQLIAETARTRVAFEINPYYHPDPWRLIGWCREAGARMSLGSNAHRREDVGFVVKVLEEKLQWTR